MAFLSVSPSPRNSRALRSLEPLGAAARLLALAFVVACSSNTPGDDDADTTHGIPKGGSAGTSAGAGRSAGGAAATGGSSGTGTGAGAGGASNGGSAGTGVAAGGSAGSGTGASGGLPGSGGMGGAGAGQGGVAGTGAVAGAAGTGPVGGSGGDAGGPGAGAGGGGGKATGFFTEDFESSTTGMQPMGWDNFISYQKNNPQNPSGMIEVLTDTMHVHGGTKAVHMHGDGNPAQLVRALPKGLTKLYVRAWVFMTRKLGQQTDSSANHESLIVLRAKSGDANNEVRFGEIKGVIGTNEVPSDNISPTMDKWHQATGPVVQPNVWSCIEVSFLADAMPNTLHATADGMAIHDITSIGTDQWQNGAMPSDWLAKKFAGDSGNAPEIVLGWQSFSSAANDVWMDDIVLSNDPIGCN
ncbi:MAG TPA: hypothetical protein VGQ57_14500 [Polyangiaceae bacterium]|jgi:hypothetical protein|nr:hypothetical protein [Polyangiaceae bacterium]